MLFFFFSPSLSCPPQADEPLNAAAVGLAAGLRALEGESSPRAVAARRVLGRTLAALQGDPRLGAGALDAGLRFVRCLREQSWQEGRFFFFLATAKVLGCRGCE